MMFGTQTIFFVIAVVVLVCTTPVFGQTRIKATFTEEKKGRDHAIIGGTLYYLYHPNEPKKSRLRLEYNLQDVTVTNFYHYGDNAMYSLCPGSCESKSITECADPWYFDSKYYTRGEKEGNYYWYTRNTAMPDISDKDKLGPQISKILMGTSTSASTDIRKIVFKNGKNLTLSNVELNKIGANDDKFKDSFKQTNNCQKPTCSIYADIVFVLDNSRSVYAQDWTDSVKFVKEVMNKFEFGENGVQAAIVEFSAPIITSNELAPYQKTWNNGWCTRVETDPKWYANDGNPDSVSVYSPQTASIIGGNDINNTLTGDKTVLERILNTTGRPEKGSTCQGYGLEIAMHLFNKSPRRNNARVPDRIVIVVTDGEDKCPNRTADNAERLRRKVSDVVSSSDSEKDSSSDSEKDSSSDSEKDSEEESDYTLKKAYGAFLIEIGVGIDSGCNNYDKHFLQRIASKLGTEPAYYPVDNYDAIKNVAEQFFKPLCENYVTECGPGCDAGFCGCGRCFCPPCESTGSTCSKYTCIESDGTVSGCNLTTVPCEGTKADGICSFYQCNGDKENEEERCTIVQNDCADLKLKYPQESQCYKVDCDTGKRGCKAEPNNTWCQEHHGGNRCIVYQCNETAPGAFSDHCYLAENKIEQHQQTLDKLGDCFSATCDPESGTLGRSDTCQPDPDPKCYENKCRMKDDGSGKYGCVRKELDRLPDDDCGHYVCNHANGWELDPNTVENEESCTKKVVAAYKEEHPGISDSDANDLATRCKLIGCNGNGGCYNESVPNCNPVCTPHDINNCINEGVSESNGNSVCVAKTCDAIKTGDIWTTKCVYSNEPHAVNCYQTLGPEAANKNTKFSNKCYTPVCSLGKCILRDQPIPVEYVTTACKKPKCIPDGNDWKWAYVNTEEGDKCDEKKCQEGGCYSNCVCDPDTGCQRKEICLSKDNECATYTCDVDSDGTEKCNEHLVERKKTTCKEQVCSKEGKLVWQDIENIQDVCVPPNDCYYFFTCEYDDDSSKCVFKQKQCSYEDRSNPCYTCECNNKTGEFVKTKNCVDELGCTVDQCDASTGTCNFRKTINCYEEIDMSAYPCFKAVCKEPKPDQKTEKGFVCQRKLLQNAYIDICGNCIAGDDSGGGSSSSSQEQTTSMECADAPAKPLLQEGLAAASIALIILGAVLIGAGIAASGIAGTKTLMNRAKGANNQSAHTNPLFEDNDAEMTNPAYVGTE